MLQLAVPWEINADHVSSRWGGVYIKKQNRQLEFEGLLIHLVQLPRPG